MILKVFLHTDLHYTKTINSSYRLTFSRRIYSSQVVLRYKRRPVHGTQEVNFFNVS